MSLGALNFNYKFPSVQKDLTFKLFQKFSFDAFFVMRTSFGHLVNFWKDTNKPFGLSVLNNRVFFNIESSFVSFRRMFLFLAEALESYRRFSIFFVSGLPVYDDFKSFYFFHRKNMPLLGHGFMIHWLGGLLTNLHCMLRTFFCNSEAVLLKYKKQIKRDWFTSVQAGLRQLKQFPDVVCFFSISGIYEIAIKEAKILKIPTIAFVDSNCEVSDITFPVVGNDDSMLGLEYKILLFREFLLRSIKQRLFSEINSLLVQNSDLRQEVFNQGMEMLVSDLIVNRKFTYLQKNQTFSLAGLDVSASRRRKVSIDLKTYFFSLSHLFCRKIMRSKFKALYSSFFRRAGTSVCSKYKNSVSKFLKHRIEEFKMKSWEKVMGKSKKKSVFFCGIARANKTKKNVRFKLKSSLITFKLRELFFVKRKYLKFAYFFYLFFQFFFSKQLSFVFDRFFFIFLLKKQINSVALFYFYQVLALKKANLRFFFKYRSFVFSNCFTCGGKKYNFNLFRISLLALYRLCSSVIFDAKLNLKTYSKKIRVFDKKFAVSLKRKIQKKQKRQETDTEIRYKEFLLKNEERRPLALSFRSVRHFLRVKHPGSNILQLKSLVTLKLCKLKRKNTIKLARKLQRKYYYKFKFFRFGSGFRQYEFLSSFFFRRRRIYKRGWKTNVRYPNFSKFNKFKKRGRFVNKFKVKFVKRHFHFRKDINPKLRAFLRRPRRIKGGLKFKFVLRDMPKIHRFSIQTGVAEAKAWAAFRVNFYQVFFFKKFLSKFFPFVKRTARHGLQRSTLFKSLKRVEKRFLKLRQKFIVFYRRRKRTLVFKKLKLLVFRYLLQIQIWDLIHKKWSMKRTVLGCFTIPRLRSLVVLKKIVFRLFFTDFMVQKLVLLCLSEVNLFFFYGFFLLKTSKVNFLFLFFSRLFYYLKFMCFTTKGFWKVVKVGLLKQFQNVFFLLCKLFHFNSEVVKRTLKFSSSGNFVRVFFRNLRARVIPLFFNEVFFKKYRFNRFYVFLKFRKFYLNFLNSSQLSLVKLKGLFINRKGSFKLKKKRLHRFRVMSHRLFRLGSLYYNYFSVLQLRARLLSKRRMFQKRYRLSAILPLERKVMLPEKKSYLNFFFFLFKRKRARISFFFKFKKKYIKSLNSKDFYQRFNSLRVF